MSSFPWPGPEGPCAARRWGIFPGSQAELGKPPGGKALLCKVIQLVNRLHRNSPVQLETSAKYHFVILSQAKDLVFTRAYKILRSLCSLRMTGEGTFAEVSTWEPESQEKRHPPPVYLPSRRSFRALFCRTISRHRMALSMASKICSLRKGLVIKSKAPLAMASSADSREP
jgi:hypothetical protein